MNIHVLVHVFLIDGIACNFKIKVVTQCLFFETLSCFFIVISLDLSVDREDSLTS